MKEKVYIIMINFNGFQDTIQSIKSILINVYQNFEIILVDNFSSENSCIEIENYFKLKHISYNIINKPQLTKKKYQVTFIKSIVNLGFSGGNNLGLKQASLNGNFNYLWLLNNDTIIDKNALLNLVNFYKSTNNRLGIVGSKLIHMGTNKIQALGGKINNYTGITKFIVNENEIDKINFIIGASMFFSKNCFEKIGYLPEKYFLFYEDADYSLMCSRNHFMLATCLKSIVYHKEGGSTKNRLNNNNSIIQDFFGLRNRKMFIKNNFPNRVFFVYFTFIISFFKRIVQLQFKRLLIIYDTIFNYHNIKNKKDILEFIKNRY